MKAIFLDIDGVVATPTSLRYNYLLGREPHNQWYDPVTLHYLGRLVAETGATVVLSSNWRRDDGEEDPWIQAVMANLFDQLEAAGAPVKYSTPQLPSYDRSEEIAAWLEAHPCETWVIFDDLARFDARPDVCGDHLILIPESDGIRWQHYSRALAILNEGHA